MKHLELYKKYRINYPNYPNVLNPMFSKGNLRFTLFIILAGLFIEPLIMYKHHKRMPLSWDYYLHQVEYFSLIVIPFGIYFLWTNWRERIKRNSNYRWVGEFEVLNKQTSFMSCYLLLTPGHGNKIKVSRSLFNKTRIGDRIEINRNALGNIEKIKRINGIKMRLKRAEAKRVHSTDKITK